MRTQRRFSLFQGAAKLGESDRAVNESPRPIVEAFPALRDLSEEMWA
jgi:hypothetical protein